MLQIWAQKLAMTLLFIDINIDLLFTEINIRHPRISTSVQRSRSSRLLLHEHRSVLHGPFVHTDIGRVEPFVFSSSSHLTGTLKEQINYSSSDHSLSLL